MRRIERAQPHQERHDGGLGRPRRAIGDLEPDAGSVYRRSSYCLTQRSTILTSKLLAALASLIQFPVNRKEWIGKYQGSGKVCITTAVNKHASFYSNHATLRM